MAFQRQVTDLFFSRFNLCTHCQPLVKLDSRVNREITRVSLWRVFSVSTLGGVHIISLLLDDLLVWPIPFYIFLTYPSVKTKGLDNN